MSATSASAPAPDLTLADSFGAYLKSLRRRARLTQDELGRAVGYSREQINRLERNQRQPDTTTLASLFVPALDLRDNPELVARLLQLAAQARGEPVPAPLQISHTIQHRVTLKTTRSRRGSESARDAHRAAAEWAELAQGDVIQAAHEYGLAGDFKRAADTLTDQGTLLFNQGKADAAATVIDELLEALTHKGLAAKYPDLLRALLTTRGDLLINTTRANEAEKNYQQALDLASGAVRAALVYRWSNALTQRGRAAEALGLVQAALEQLAPEHRLLRAQMKLVEGGAQMMLSQYEQAIEANTDAIALADEFAVAMPMLAAGVRARAHNVLGALNAIRGQRAEAFYHWQNAVATARLAGIRTLEYRAQGNIANLEYEQGNLDDAEATCDAALVGLQSIGDMQAAAKFIHLRANLHFLRGEFEASAARAREACALKETLGDRNSYFASLHQFIKAQIVMGNLSEARRVAETNLPEVEALGDERTVGYWLTTLSEVEMLEDEVGQARTSLERVMNSQGAEDPKLVSDCANHLAVAALAQGDAVAAQAILARVSDHTLETNLERDLVTVLASRMLGDTAAANSLVESVIERAGTSGYRHLERRAEKIKRALSESVQAHPPARLMYGTL